MSKEDISIIIGGDIYPKGKVESHFINGEAKDIFHDLLPILKDADYTVVNLECPLADKETPILKDGAALRATTNTINGIKAAGIDAVNLSNNHILDQGSSGLQSTLSILSNEQIACFGAGENILSAAEPHITTIKNKRIAFIGVAEHEFTIATDSNYGANPLDVPNNFRQIKTIRDEVDYLILLYHGGKEHYPYPTPKQQKISRFFIDEGVDVVIAQHSHIAGSYENYMGKHIVYGQGNLLFEKLSRNYQSWCEGVLIQLDIKDDKINIEFIPFDQSNGFIGARKMNKQMSDDFLLRFWERSNKVLDTNFVKDSWRNLCLKELPLYESRLHGHNRLLRVLNRKFNFAKWLYPKWKKMMLRNVVECETHREGLETLWRDDKIEF